MSVENARLWMRSAGVIDNEFCQDLPLLVVVSVFTVVGLGFL